MLSRASRSRSALRALLTSTKQTSWPATTMVNRFISPQIRSQIQTIRPPCRHIHSTFAVRKGITPDSEDPTPPSPEANNTNGATNNLMEASSITEAEYRDASEHYFNVILAEIERVQEETGSDIEAEYSAGVLNVTLPGIGVYVLNKQPPNKQIWLSSPISGPKRFDWVMRGDGMTEKEGTREYIGGQWIYLRDGSNLTNLLNEELSLEMDQNIYDTST
ncbi:Mitochondrial chaperone Frataxin [Myotisia sp. PD_48]|nr:Mitochondrial chaperone Frataxin [Myotisia sp. PD_48]